MSTFPESAHRLFTNAIANGTVSIVDRYSLMAALLDRDLKDPEFAAVDQLVQAIFANANPTPSPRPVCLKPTPGQSRASMTQQFTRPWNSRLGNLRWVG